MHHQKELFAARSALAMLNPPLLALKFLWRFVVPGAEALLRLRLQLRLPLSVRPPRRRRLRDYLQ
jgi:hypothetical protein